MQHLRQRPKKDASLHPSLAVQARVRFLAYHRIKPHVPPLVRAPVNSFEFHRCRRTPQVEYLTLSLGSWPCIANCEYSSFTVRTTRVSNPVWYPHFRASASVVAQMSAFAIGVLHDIWAFHRYTMNSNISVYTQDNQYQLQPDGWAAVFHNWLNCPPALPLNPINPDNARTFRITAAAGTELAGPFSDGTCKGVHEPHFIPN